MNIFTWSNKKTAIILDTSLTTLHCRCGYEGLAEKVETQFFRSGYIERCPNCKSPVQNAVKPKKKELTLRDI